MTEGTEKPNIEDMATFCKRKGIIYPSSDIYGGLAGFFDYGPYGSDLKQNVKTTWWQFFVQSRPDVTGIDGSIISNPDIWEASGHVENFVDLVLVSEDGKTMERADHYLEDELGGEWDGVSAEEVDELVEEHSFAAPNGSPWRPCQPFNLMFQTFVGPKQDDSTKTYLRPETAQIIFTNFRYATENARLTLPFGIAQIGKAFRNEISPRNFIFRSREFEQMEIEHFVHPEKDTHELSEDVEGIEIQVYTAEHQDNEDDMENHTLKALVDQGTLSAWHAEYLGRGLQWFSSLGCDTTNFRVREHLSDELSHYSNACWDLEYRFPFGYKEIMGVADRTDHDLQSHIEGSNANLTLYDHEAKKKVVPHVAAEPSMGVDRAVLVFLYEAYEDDEERGNIVLHLHPAISPVDVAVFPLLKNKPDLVDVAKDIYDDLRFTHHVFYDESGSIGRRYARQDEIGTPYCVTVDFDTLDDEAVTVRNRDTTEQDRVPIEELHRYFAERLRPDYSK